MCFKCVILYIFGSGYWISASVGDTIIEKEETALMGDYNYTVLVAEVEITAPVEDGKYDELLADMWVGVVLTLMVLSCVCCLCSCLLYHKFQQWKQRVLESRARAARDTENGDGEVESLPSYTIVSGLPSYEEALEQLKQVKQQCSTEIIHEKTPQQQQTPHLSRLSVFEFFRSSKTNS